MRRRGARGNRWSGDQLYPELRFLVGTDRAGRKIISRGTSFTQEGRTKEAICVPFYEVQAMSRELWVAMLS